MALRTYGAISVKVGAETTSLAVMPWMSVLPTSRWGFTSVDHRS